ncbi:MAG: hypothetical protein V1888_04200 [archaeon]
MVGNCDYVQTNECPYLTKGCSEVAIDFLSETHGRYKINKEIRKITKRHGKEFGPEGKNPRRTWKLRDITHLCLWTDTDTRIIEWEHDMRESYFDFPGEGR